MHGKGCEYRFLARYETKEVAEAASPARFIDEVVRIGYTDSTVGAADSAFAWLGVGAGIAYDGGEVGDVFTAYEVAVSSSWLAWPCSGSELWSGGVVETPGQVLCKESFVEHAMIRWNTSGLGGRWCFGRRMCLCAWAGTVVVGGQGHCVRRAVDLLTVCRTDVGTTGVDESLYPWRFCGGKECAGLARPVKRSPSLDSVLGALERSPSVDSVLGVG